MKKREGFVSNSSSSSFVLYSSKEAMDAALAECTEFERKVVEVSLGEERDFLGRRVCSYTYPVGNNAESWMDEIQSVIYDFFDDNFNEENIVAAGFDLPDEDEQEDLDEYIQEKTIDFAQCIFETMVEEKAKELGETVMRDSFDF